MLSKGPCRFLFQLLSDLSKNRSLAGGVGGDRKSLDVALLSVYDDEKGLFLVLGTKPPCESKLNVDPADTVDPDVVESIEPFR